METFTFTGEDETLGVLIRGNLLRNPDVLFAAFKIEHPMTRTVQIAVETLERSPEVAMNTAFEDSRAQVRELAALFGKKLV